MLGKNHGGVVQLVKLNDEVFPTRVNGSRLKLYKDNPPTHLAQGLVESSADVQGS